jgi:predicted N-acetyltransferase YhbS
MSSTNFAIRAAARADLEAINQVIESAVMTWNLPERVKRLSLPSYCYSEMDLAHLQLVVAEESARRIIGVVAWERADARDAPQGRNGLLLHGIYVAPAHHRQGVGSALLSAAETAARNYHYDGLLVKAQEDATGFFVSRGLRKLPAEKPLHQYANRLWKDLRRI